MNFHVSKSLPSPTQVTNLNTHDRGSLLLAASNSVSETARLHQLGHLFGITSLQASFRSKVLEGEEYSIILGDSMDLFDFEEPVPSETTTAVVTEKSGSPTRFSTISGSEMPQLTDQPSILDFLG